MRAQAEAGAFRDALRAQGVEVAWVEGSAGPDAVFPNNWFSTHDSGQLVLYPMLAPSRRRERRPDLVAQLQARGLISELIDLTAFESEGHFLEGIGSLVLDRVHSIAYAGYSSRTHSEPLQEFAHRLGYRVVAFEMRRQDGSEIYHTNVMLSIGAELAVICPDAIPDEEERDRVLRELRESGHEIVLISQAQMQHFCANVLELQSATGEWVWAMSESARSAFLPEQLEIFQSRGRVVASPLPTIEAIGGGSARCMIAEIFLEERA